MRARSLWLSLGLSFRRGLALALLAPLACTSGSTSADSAGAGGDGGLLGPDGGPVASSIEFTLASPYVYVPGEVLDLGVRVSPPDVYTVRLALVGDSRDAFLDQSTVTTAVDGTALVRVTTPTSPATFSVRASVGSASAVLDATTGVRFGQVAVTPVYSGHRKVNLWTATVRTGLECSTPGVPPPDGPVQATAPVGEKPLLEHVPAETPITVTVRAGNFAGGCAELASIQAGGTTPVSVAVNDRPLQLDGLALPVTLQVTLTQPLADAWFALASRMTAAFTGTATNDTTALLDAMEASAPASVRDVFVAARGSRNWDTLVASALSLDARGIRTMLSPWLQGGLPPVDATALSGTLTTTKDPAGVLTFTSIAGVAPSIAGFSPTVTVSLTGETDDRVLFGGTATWKPSRLAAALAAVRAQQAVHGAKGVPDALATSLRCADLAAAVVDAGTGLAYAGCDATCVTTLCEQALEAMWSRASDAESAVVSFDIAASGVTTRIDDTAHPVAISGTWVGTTTLDGKEAKLGGPSTLGPPR